MTHKLVSPPLWYRSARGFTLVETMVVLGIIAIVSALTVGLVGFQRVSKFDEEVQTTLAELRQQQSKARTVNDNKEYGMQFATDSWTTYDVDPATATQTTGTTQTLSNSTLSAVVTPTASQVTFERLTGRTKNASSATLTFSRSTPSRSRSIKIEPDGRMYVQ